MCVRARQARPTQEVSTIAASIAIEDECGTFTGIVHAHNGYYAGEFSAPRPGGAGTPQGQPRVGRGLYPWPLSGCTDPPGVDGFA